MSPRDLFENYAFIVVIALILGLATGGFPGYPAEITIAALAIMMTLSLSEIRITRGSFSGLGGPTVAAIALNYLLLTGMILLIAQFFEDELRSGWILMAAVPSAVAVVPFTYMIGGDTRFSLVGTTTIYLLALILAPLITLMAIGQEIERLRLIFTILLLIVIPLIISRLPTLRNMKRVRKTPLINLCFGILVFTMIGANRNAFEELSMVAWISLASLIRTFCIGLLVLWVLRRIKISSDKAKVLTLFASYKNLGLTAAIAMAIIGSEAAIPAAICIPFEIIWLIALKAATKERRHLPSRNSKGTAT